jgi:hypothetical protein
MVLMVMIVVNIQIYNIDRFLGNHTADRHAQPGCRKHQQLMDNRQIINNICCAVNLLITKGSDRNIIHIKGFTIFDKNKMVLDLSL